MHVAVNVATSTCPRGGGGGGEGAPISYFSLRCLGLTSNYALLYTSLNFSNIFHWKVLAREPGIRTRTHVHKYYFIAATTFRPMIFRPVNA
jgi:hypothetical protein